MSFSCNFCAANVERLKDLTNRENVPVAYCPNLCCRTAQDREQEAEERLGNRIFFNGMTAHGYQKPIFEAINPRFKDEITGRPKLSDFAAPKAAGGEQDGTQGKIDHEKLSENFRMIDVYSGLVDGKHYGRFNRLKYQKIKHARNRYGTEQRFCVPIVSSYSYGWWTRDFKELNKTKWYAPRERFPNVRSDVTRFLDELAKHDPNYVFF